MVTLCELEIMILGKIKYIFCEGFVKGNLNSKKHDLEIFWCTVFQSDLSFSCKYFFVNPKIKIIAIDEINTLVAFIL